MTSDKAKVSTAQRQLDLALGEKRVSLKGLRPEEFDHFLSTVLRKIDLRELRGFRPLEEYLSRRSLNNSKDPEENIIISPNVRFTRPKLLDSKTHLVSVSRGVLDQTIYYRRNESGEETTDWQEADSWTNGYQTCRIEASLLFIRRPSDHTRADENLFIVAYVCDKVPLRNQMEVVWIHVTPVPIKRFRSQFGARYPEIAQNLIWEVCVHVSRTLDALKSKVESFRPVVERFERISAVISE